MSFYEDGLSSPLILDACESFAGGQVSFARSASRLQPHEAAEIVNLDVSVNGELFTRRGTRPIGGLLDGNPFAPQAMLYNDTPDAKRLLAWKGGRIYRYDTSTRRWAMVMQSGTVDPAVDCCQLSDLIYWTDASRGLRVWDGLGSSEGVTIAEGVTDGETDAGFFFDPRPACLALHGTRLVAGNIAGVPDGVAFSDLLDGKHWSTTAQLRVGGEGDPIVAVASWQDNNVLVWKNRSTWIIEAAPWSQVADFNVKMIHGTIGCVARRTVAQVGQDVWFLSQNGVQSVRKQIATSNNEVPVPVSQRVQDVIERINWSYADRAAAVFYRSQYILSIPVDGSTVPNLCLVYNANTDAWSTFDGFDAGVFLEVPDPIAHGTRLIIGRNEGTMAEWTQTCPYYERLPSLNLTFDLPAMLPTAVPVLSSVTTRAMIFNDPVSPKTGFYAEIEHSCNDCDFSVSAILDGGEPVTVRYSYRFGKTLLKQKLPFMLHELPNGYRRERIPLHHLGQFREIQFRIQSTRGRLNVRSINATAFGDTIELRSQNNSTSPTIPTNAALSSAEKGNK